MFVIVCSVIGIILLIVIIFLLSWYIKRTYQCTVTSKSFSIAQIAISASLVIVTIILAIATFYLFFETKKYAESTIENYRILNRPFVKVEPLGIYKGKKYFDKKEQQDKTPFTLTTRIKNYGNIPAFVSNGESYIKKTDSSEKYLKIPRGTGERTWDNLSLFKDDETDITWDFSLGDSHVGLIKGADESVYIVLKIEYYTLGDDNASQEDPFIYWSKFKYVGFNREAVIKRKIETYEVLTQQQKDTILQQKRFSIIECGVGDEKFISINE